MSALASKRPLPDARQLSQLQQYERAKRQVFYRTICNNPYLPTKWNTRALAKLDGLDRQMAMTRPSPRQIEFLFYHGPECLYGGAAGGGKSDAILMAAAQYVESPRYAALILRREGPHLSQDGGLIPRAKQWFMGPWLAESERPHWNQQEKRFTFPSGATITFGYCDHTDHLQRYQGGAWQTIAIDEASQMEPAWILYMFSRLRRIGGSSIPDRLRLASNPGGKAHDFLRRRYGCGRIRAAYPDQMFKHFVPASLDDNPGLDRARYRSAMANLDPLTRAQLLAGDWDTFLGGRFQPGWFRSFITFEDDHGCKRFLLQGREEIGYLVSDCWWFIIVDPAATAEDSSCYTAIGLFGVVPASGDLLVMDIDRRRLTIDQITPAVERMCEKWRPLWVGYENVNFQITLIRAAQMSSKIPGVLPISPEGKGKLVRATPAINMAFGGQMFLPDDEIPNQRLYPSDLWPEHALTARQRQIEAEDRADAVRVVRAPDEPPQGWKEDYVAELVAFTGDDKLDSHVDQVDITAYAAQKMHAHGVVSKASIASEAEEEDEYHTKAESYGGMYGWKR